MRFSLVASALQRRPGRKISVKTVFPPSRFQVTSEMTQPYHCRRFLLAAFHCTLSLKRQSGRRHCFGSWLIRPFETNPNNRTTQGRERNRGEAAVPAPGERVGGPVRQGERGTDHGGDIAKDARAEAVDSVRLTWSVGELLFAIQFVSYRSLVTRRENRKTVDSSVW